MNQINNNLYQIDAFKYQQINSIQLKQDCSEIKLNHKQSILVLSLSTGLQKFFQFKKGEYKFIGNFNEIENNMWLYFYRKQQIYLSLNSRNTFKIWTVNSINYNKVLCKYKFNKRISVLLMNQSEDLMIIGCSEGYLHIKRHEQLQWISIQEIKLSDFLEKIALNQQENKIIVKLYDQKVKIVEKNITGDKQLWKVVQEIQLYNSFSDLIFICENTFAVKLMNIQRWMIFKQKNNNQFNYKRDIQIFGFNDELQYILNKYHKNKLRNQDQSNLFLNSEYYLEQSYLSKKDNQEFQNQSCFIRYHQDRKIFGEYLIGLDYKKHEIFIGKYQQLFIEYQMFKQLDCLQDETCQSIAFNIPQQILILGLSNQIKVFKLMKLTFTQEQLLNNHSGDVSCLLFFQNVNSFISGSLDKTLIIWTWDEIAQIYQCQQILNSTVEQKFIILNRQENLLVSGGNNLISFWIFKSSKWIQQQTLNFDQNSIYGLNFSPSQQLIATYTQNHKIILIKNKYNKTQNFWYVSLQINVKDFTPSFCFISDLIILFQSVKESTLRLIKFNYDCDEIQYQTKILYNKVCDEKNTFPMQFNQQKKLVISQTVSQLNLILIVQGNQILHHQEIPFKCNHILGLLSIDGEFLITLDKHSNRIQIMKYHSN